MTFFKQLVVLSVIFLGSTLDAMEKERTFYVHIEASQDKYHTSSSNVKETQTNELSQTNNSFYRPNINYIKEIKDNLKSREYRDNLHKTRASLEEKWNKCTFDNAELKKQINFIDALLDGSINRLLVQIKKGDLKTATKAFTTLKKAWPREDNHVSSIVVGHSSIESNFIEIIGTDIMQIARNSLVLRKDFLEANGVSIPQIITYQIKIRDLQLQGDRKALITEHAKLTEQLLKERHGEFKLAIEAKLIIVHTTLSNPMTQIFSTIKNAHYNKAVRALDDLKELLSDHFEAHNITNKAEAKADMIKREGVDLISAANKCFKSRADYQAKPQTSNDSQDNSGKILQTKKVIANDNSTIKPTYAFDNIVDFENDTMKLHKVSIQSNSTCASRVITNNSEKTSHNSAPYNYAYADMPSSTRVNTNDSHNTYSVCDNKMCASGSDKFIPTPMATFVAAKIQSTQGNDGNYNNTTSDPHPYYKTDNPLDRKECFKGTVINEFKRMQLNGDKKGLEIRKEQLEKELKNTWLPWNRSSIKAQIAEIDIILKSPITETLSIIRDADFYTACITFYSFESSILGISEEGVFNMKAYNLEESEQQALNAAREIFHSRSEYQPPYSPTYGDIGAQVTNQSKVQNNNSNKSIKDSLTQKPINNSTTTNNQSTTSNNKQVTTNKMTYAQHMVTKALNPTYNLNLVAQKLGDSVDTVYAHADKYNYFIPHEVDLQIQTSLDTLPTVQNAKEFAYNIATINHLLCDIQDQTAIQNDLPLNVSERSPDLLTRAIQEYWKDLAPTENEISFISDLAYYISDVTIGTSYLTPEVVEQRVQSFWNGIDKLSFEHISQITTEDWIDTSAYVAARITWAASITKTAAVLRNLKNIGTAASGAMVSFADKFIRIFDNVIGASPAVITADGALVVNASPVVVAEATQAIYSLNDMQNTGDNKPKIIKDVDSVLGNEKTPELSPKVESSLKDLTITSNKIKKLHNRVFKPEHVFSDKHKKNGIFNLGKTEEEITLKFIEIIKKADQMNVLKEKGWTRLWTEINGYEVEVHAFIENETLLSINGFINFSDRVNPIPVRI